MRVFWDANILFSAARAGSAVERALHELADAGVMLVTGQHAVEEARRNLSAKRAGDLPGLERWVPRLEITALMVSVSHLNLVVKDQPVFGGALAAGCTHFVTGDLRHFGDWMGQTIEGVKVVTLARLLAEWDANRVPKDRPLPE